MSGLHIVPDQLLPSDIEAFRKKAAFEIPLSPPRIVATIGDATLVERRVRCEVFSLTQDEQSWLFNVRDIKDAIVAGNTPCLMFKGTLNEEWYQHILTNGGVEEPRLAALTEEDDARPGVMVFMHDGTSCLIDGNHRLVSRWRKGLRDFRFGMVPLTHIQRWVHQSKRGE